MYFAEMPCVRLTAEQKLKALTMLRRCACLLKKWSVFYHPKKFRQFRNDVMNGNDNPQTQVVCNDKSIIKQDAIPAERLAEFKSDLPDIRIVRKPLPEFENRSVEQAVLESVSSLAKHHVMKWCLDDKKDGTNGLTRQDYLQEAYMSIIEAIYQYNREDVDITTFVWRTLHNRMINVTNQSNLLSRLTNSDLSLVCRYDKMRHANGGSFYQIVESLGLSEDEGRHLSLILTKVVSGNKNADDGNDYTGQRSGIDREVSIYFEPNEKYNVDNILNRANLNDLERTVLEKAMNSSRGWQSEFARTHVSVVTGKSYSRMRITQVLEKAREKVAKVLQLLKEAEAA